MVTIIETPRLLMRQFVLADAEAVFAFSANEEVSRYTGDAGSVTSIDEALKIITDIWLVEYEKYGYGRFALIHKETDHLIGFCGLKFMPEEGRADLGYRMLPEYWGQGLGYEGAAAVLKYGRETLGLKDIFAEADVRNTASNRILVKLGMQVMRQHDDYGFLTNFYEDGS